MMNACRARHVVCQRIGRRGSTLLVIAAIWTLLAVGLIVMPEQTPDPDEMLFHQALPTWMRVTLLLGTAAVAATASVVPRNQQDRWGFVALMVLPGERAASYFVGWLYHVYTDGDRGYEHGLVSAFAWLSVVALILIITGWPEPERRMRGGIPEPPRREVL